MQNNTNNHPGTVGPEQEAIPNRTDHDCAKDVVCPVCFRPTLSAGLKYYDDRYGRNLRRYLGWCRDCLKGFEVIQFARDNRWVIHKYQLYLYGFKTGKSFRKTISKEQILNDLPEPAPVVTGPGGDYDKQCDLSDINLHALEAIYTVLKNSAKAIKNLINLHKDERIS